MTVGIEMTQMTGGSACGQVICVNSTTVSAVDHE